MKKAYSEVSEILKYIDNELVNKIPKEIINVIENEKDKEYNATINPNIPLEEQNLLPETISILAMLKLDYWCESKEEKDELLSILNKNELEFSEKNREKYDIERIFEKRKKNTEIAIIPNKESYFKKILNMIKKLFRK